MLFTFILEFGGGTYIHQLREKDVLEALTEYAGYLRSTSDIERRDLDELADDLLEDKPVELSGVKSIWCTTGLAGEDHGLLNIIATADPRDTK